LQKSLELCIYLLSMVYGALLFRKSSEKSSAEKSSAEQSSEQSSAEQSSEKSSEPVAQHQTSDWQCINCTVTNWFGTKVCHVCNHAPQDVQPQQSPSPPVLPENTDWEDSHRILMMIVFMNDHCHHIQGIVCGDGLCSIQALILGVIIIRPTGLFTSGFCELIPEQTCIHSARECLEKATTILLQLSPMFISNTSTVEIDDGIVLTRNDHETAIHEMTSTHIGTINGIGHLKVIAAMFGVHVELFDTTSKMLTTFGNPDYDTVFISTNGHHYEVHSTDATTLPLHIEEHALFIQSWVGSEIQPAQKSVFLGNAHEYDL